MKVIKPILRPLIVNGRLMYDERAKAYALIRFKRRIIDLFPQLKSEQDWCYLLEYWQDHPTTIQRLKESQKNNEGVPLLLFIYPTKKEGYYGSVD